MRSADRGLPRMTVLSDATNDVTASLLFSVPLQICSLRFVGSYKFEKQRI